MPTLNAVGQWIQDYTPTRQERKIMRHVKHLVYPRDHETIRRLSDESYKLWIYGLDPHDALIMSHRPMFKEILEHRKVRGKVGTFIDWCWRKYHGIPI